jgi:hypothetical protein
MITAIRPSGSLARWRRRGPRVGPGTSVNRVKDGQLSLVDGPRGVVEGIGGVGLGVLGVLLGSLDVPLVTPTLDAGLQVGPLGRGIGLQRGPLALSAVGGLPGLVSGGILAGRDVRLEIVNARLDLLV